MRIDDGNHSDSISEEVISSANLALAPEPALKEE
jgi:hypothetical protein